MSDGGPDLHQQEDFYVELKRVRVVARYSTGLH